MVQNMFQVHSYSRTTYVFYVSLQFLLLILSNIRVIFLAFLGQKKAILRIGIRFKLFWSLLKYCNTVVEQILFCIFLSMLTFDFDLNLGPFLTFWGPNGQGLTTVFGSTHVVEQLSFSMFPSILTFDFVLILQFFQYCDRQNLITGFGHWTGLKYQHMKCE